MHPASSTTAAPVETPLRMAGGLECALSLLHELTFLRCGIFQNNVL
jgi:hypothetical protein